MCSVGGESHSNTKNINWVSAPVSPHLNPLQMGEEDKNIPRCDVARTGRYRACVKTQLPSAKGAKCKSPGQRPGCGAFMNTKALKARDRGSFYVIPRLQRFVFLEWHSPGPLAQAITFRAFGADIRSFHTGSTSTSRGSVPSCRSLLRHSNIRSGIVHQRHHGTRQSSVFGLEPTSVTQGLRERPFRLDLQVNDLIVIVILREIEQCFLSSE